MLYFVNNAKVDDIQGPYRTGDTVEHPFRTEDGKPVRVTLWGPNVRDDIYEGRQDPTAPGPGDRVIGMTEALVGPPRVETSYVQQTLTKVEDLDQLLAERRGELATRYDAALHQGTDVILPSDSTRYPARTTTDARLTYGDVQAATVLPAITQISDVDAYGDPWVWQRGDAEQIRTNVALHALSCNGNRATHDAELERLHGANDRAGLESYDLSTGWPPPPTRQPAPQRVASARAALAAASER